MDVPDHVRHLIDRLPEFEDSYWGPGGKYHELLENRHCSKIGGWPSLIQSEIFWAPLNRHPADPEYVLQIDTEPKAHWAWGMRAQATLDVAPETSGTAGFWRGTATKGWWEDRQPSSSVHGIATMLLVSGGSGERICYNTILKTHEVASTRLVIHVVRTRVESA